MATSKCILDIDTCILSLNSGLKVNITLLSIS